MNLQRLFKPGRYNMNMGLGKLDERNWLMMNDGSLPEHQLREELLTQSKSCVLQCLPESKSACQEVLEVVLDFLAEKWPDAFKRSRANTNIIRNNKTGKVFDLNVDHPLWIAAMLVTEDLNVLMKSDKGYTLAASATCFPVGWSLEERIGWPITRLHMLVPGWEEKIGNHVEKYFSRMKPSDFKERSSFFVQTTPMLFHPRPLPTSATTTLKVDDIIIRCERQTFRCLPKSKAILFTVRTFVYSLVKLGEEDLANFSAAVKAWPDDMASYKGRQFWGPVALNYCDRGESVPMES